MNEALRADVPNAEHDENTRDLKNNVSESEIAAKLRPAANTAPGYDKVEYAHLKRIDPSAKILTPMFNRCIQLRSEANTAPGADRVEYAHLKKIDPLVRFLRRSSIRVSVP